jgi:hypothetical protein
MPHVIGPAGQPPPATRNEVLLRGAVDRLRAQLDAARQVVDAARLFTELEVGYDIWGTEAQARFDALRRAVEAYDPTKFREGD